jgi:hypothetical protein
MSPKEKAEELVQKFSSKLPWYSQKDNLSKSKQCSLIAVDIILIDCGAKDWSGDEACDGKNYWEEVKQEIENL